MRNEEPCAAELLGATFRALSHELRSSLSVISNELHYLSSLVPAEECARAVRRCQEMSESLKLLSGISADPLRRERMNLRSLFPASDGPEESFWVVSDGRRVQELAHFVERLLMRSGCSAVMRDIDIPRRTIAWRGLGSWNEPGAAVGAAVQPLPRYSSCTIFFTESRGMQLPEAPIVDALACSLELAIAVLPAADARTIEVCFPVEQVP